MNKKFKEIDEAFTCINCNKEVNPLGYSSRDHCPYCLYALHVDINPGDRASDCKGVLVPIDYEKHKDTFKIIYKCKKCNAIRKNILANDDNYDQLLKLNMKEGK